MDMTYGSIAEQPIPDREYYCQSESHVTLKAWLLPGEMLDLYARVEDSTDLTPDRLYYLYKAVRQCLHVSGEFWECGVDGGTAAFIASILAGSGRTLRLFDTFAASPNPNPEFDFCTEPLEVTTLDSVRRQLSEFDNVEYHAGLIEETFAGLEKNPIALVHCNLGLYRSTRDCLSFCYPRMPKNGMLVISDYGLPNYAGVRTAVDEFFADKPELPMALKPGCALIIKM